MEGILWVGCNVQMRLCVLVKCFCHVDHGQDIVQICGHDIFTAVICLVDEQEKKFQVLCVEIVLRQNRGGEGIPFRIDRCKVFLQGSDFSLPFGNGSLAQPDDTFAGCAGYGVRAGVKGHIVEITVQCVLKCADRGKLRFLAGGQPFPSGFVGGLVGCGIFFRAAFDEAVPV